MARMTNQTVIVELIQKYGLHPSLANLPNLDALVDSEYKRKTNFYAGVPVEKAHATIRSEIQHMFAIMAVGKLANAFADPLLSAEKVKPESNAGGHTRTARPRSTRRDSWCHIPRGPPRWTSERSASVR